MTTATKATHTPGPWRTGDMYSTVFGPKNGTPCPDVIADVHSSNRIANAKLIAAAPEILGALEALLDIAPLARDLQTRNIHALAEAAIRKAKGEL